MSSAVTLNLILSVRKFTSLILSILLFKNEFTRNHWIGSLLVFIGTIWYSSSSASSGKKSPTKKVSKDKKMK